MLLKIFLYCEFVQMTSKVNVSYETKLHSNTIHFLQFNGEMKFVRKEDVTIF